MSKKQQEYTDQWIKRFTAILRLLAAYPRTEEYMRRRRLRTLRVFWPLGIERSEVPSRCKLSPFVPSRGHGARLSRAVCSDHGEHSRERAHAGKQATTGQPRTTRRTTPGGHRAACACGDAGRGPATAGRSCFRLRRCRGQAGGACQKPEQVALRRRRGAVRITPEDRTRPRRTAVGARVADRMPHARSGGLRALPGGAADARARWGGAIRSMGKGTLTYTSQVKSFSSPWQNCPDMGYAFAA